jgi:hypothetical protein
MKTSRRVAWLMLFLGSCLLLGILFRAFLLENLVTPVAVMLLLLWRVVLSVHQAIYWGLVVLVACCLIGYRLFQSLDMSEASAPPATDSILKSISYWRTWIMATNAQGQASGALKRELGQMLVTLYAMKQPEATPFSLFEALRLRQISLPANIYVLMFPEEAQKAQRPWKRRLMRLVEWPRQWIRQWTGREKAEYFQAIEETLTFMEALMEMKHGDNDFTPPNH